MPRVPRSVRGRGAPERKRRARFLKLMHDNLTFSMPRFAFLILLAVGLAAAPVHAQFENKWLSGGALHNWYSSAGAEIEHGFISEQQYGMRWPGLYRFTDMQAAKGFWIGARNVTGPEGVTFPFRVVHVGPRVSGAGEFFPVRFETVSRYELPAVTVDGDVSEPEASMTVNRVDPNLVSDQALFTTVNTLLGVTMERNIYQFSNPYHDNYHIIEYVFTNTGNTDDDADIELPNQTLQDVRFFWQWRWSVAKETRYLIGNATGWGLNNMVDARGDGLDQRYGTTGEDFRAIFSWHGFFPGKTLSYNNLGGPIMREGVPAVQIAASDTLGRLGASQFVGAVVLHADTAPGNEADDRSQPSVMRYIHSDDQLLSQNDPFSEAKMQREYEAMSADAQDRHAFTVEPTGEPGFLYPTRDPALGTSGGHSAALGFGPYTLAPGESVRIVMAEAAAGLSREANMAIGEAYKAAPPATRDTPNGALPVTINGVSGKTKNEWVFTSRDSLFQTFRRAIEGYDGGTFQVDAAPRPPSQFSVASGGDRISLTWDVFPGESPSGFEIYRAESNYYARYELIHTAAAGDREFADLTPKRGIDYYYYIVAVGGTTSGSDGAPAGRLLRSSRYYTQTYTPAQLQRPQGRALDEVRIVPNPFYIGSPGGERAVNSPRFFDIVDKLAFYNIPGQCRIDIYTELGELVDSIEHTNGAGDAFWDHTTASRQVVVSGVYIAVITVTEDIIDQDTGEQLFQQGETTYRKFVIVR